jgi:hypothetical protein
MEKERKGPEVLMPTPHVRESVLAPGFQASIREAFDRIVSSEECDDVLAKFKSAYEYRKHFSWLGESGGEADALHHDGVTYALRYALATYIPRELYEGNIQQTAGSGAAEQNEQSSRNSSYKTTNGTAKGARLNHKWKEGLLSAVSRAVDDEASLYRFVYSLSGIGIGTENIEPRVLSEHIAKALDLYYQRRNIGTSYDPF